MERSNKPSRHLATFCEDEQERIVPALAASMIHPVGVELPVSTSMMLKMGERNGVPAARC